MIKRHSISGRLIIGKTFGFVLGILMMLLLPLFNLPMLSMFSFGMLVMFLLMGVFTAFMGVMDRHPLFNIKMPWWLRGPVVGATFMLMFVLFTYDTMLPMMESDLITWTGLSSPFWAILDGLWIGALMEFIETKFAGDGPSLPLK